MLLALSIVGLPLGLFGVTSKLKRNRIAGIATLVVSVFVIISDLLLI